MVCCQFDANCAKICFLRLQRLPSVNINIANVENMRNIYIDETCILS